MDMQLQYLIVAKSRRIKHLLYLALWMNSIHSRKYGDLREKALIIDKFQLHEKTKNTHF